MPRIDLKLWFPKISFCAISTVNTRAEDLAFHLSLVVAGWDSMPSVAPFEIAFNPSLVHTQKPLESERAKAALTVLESEIHIYIYIYIAFVFRCGMEEPINVRRYCNYLG